MAASISAKLAAARMLHGSCCKDKLAVRNFSATVNLLLMRRLREADSEQASLKQKKPKKTKEPSKKLTVDDVRKPLKSKYPPLDSKFWKRKPVDDVWARRFYPPREFSFTECVDMHRQACVPEMYDHHNGVLKASFLLCMKTKKKTKFTNHYQGTIVLPHLFNTESTKKKILALTSNQEEVELARSFSMKLVGGVDLIRRIQSDEIVLEDAGIDTVICTTELLQNLLPVKDKLPEFPSKFKHSTGYDMKYMLEYCKSSIRYKSYSNKRDEGDPRITRLNSVPVGRLNMPMEKLEANWNHWVQTLEGHRTSTNLGSVILEAKIRCFPSPESFRVNLNRAPEEVVHDEQEEENSKSAGNESDDD